MRAWLTEDEATALVGRAAMTLRNWRLAHLVQGRKRKGVWEYERTSLIRCAESMRWRYEHRRAVPGPGRGRFPSPPDSPTLF